MTRTTRLGLILTALAIVAGMILLTQCERIEYRIYQAGVAAEHLRAGLEAGAIDTGQERIAYLHRPGPGPHVILLHGFASQKDIWLQFVHHLPDDFSVLLMDLPGHGDSSTDPDRDYRIENLATAVVRVMEARGGGQPMHLAGSSLGGAVAMLVAARHPDHVASLSLFNPGGAPGAVTSELLETGADFDNPLIVTSRQDFDRMIALVFHDPPVMPWPVARVLTRLHIERAELHRKIWSDVRDSRLPAVELLESVTAPVLLVWGERDQVLENASIEFFATHLADIRIRRMENVGHTPIMEQPEQSAGYFSDFVRRHAQAPEMQRQ